MDKEKSFRSFLFTFNNYTEEDVNNVRAYLSKAKYGIFGYEIAPSTGTPHLQGYASLKSPAKFRTIKKRFGDKVHIEPARGSAEQNRDYCSKSESADPSRSPKFEEFGELPKRGERTDLEEFKESAKSGMTPDEALEAHSSVCANYPTFVRQYYQKVQRDKVKPIEMETPRDWQQRIIDIIKSEPHPRRIYWILDLEGGKGKTYLAKHLVSKYNAFYSNGGRSADVCHAYQYQRIAIFDYVREAQEYVNYGVIEQIKNGILSSPKYESTMKTFDTPHVIVFANFRPASDKFSADRLEIIDI